MAKLYVVLICKYFFKEKKFHFFPGFINNADGRHPFGGARVPQRRYANFYRNLDEHSLHNHGYGFQPIHTSKK